MATSYVLEGRHWNLSWLVAIDPSAPRIAIPLGIMSPWHDGWAYRNTDGTYTVFLGEDIAFNQIGQPIGGTVMNVVQMTHIDSFHPEYVLAAFGGPFDAHAIGNAFQLGGEALMTALYAGSDTLDGGAALDGLSSLPCRPCAMNNVIF